jgi:8-amino-7-oxononanoate synthase
MSGSGFQQRLTASLQQLSAASQRRTKSVTVRTGPVHCIANGRHCLSFASNDYLGLSFHPQVLDAFAKAAATQAGAGASPLIVGRSPQQQQLEQLLATWEHADSITLFPSGFSANLGTLTAIAGSRDAVFCDRENHASLIDGCRSSAAKFLVYDRSQLDRLHHALQRRRSQFELVFIVTDTVYSMDGTIADLPALNQLASEFHAVLVVDEAHGSGVFGEHGRGVCELQQLDNRVPVRIGTLSKACGSLGGFVAGSSELGEWLWNAGRSQFFSTALPAAVAAAAAAAITVLIQEPERRQRLHRRCKLLRQFLEERSITVLNHPNPSANPRLSPAESPIIGVPLQDPNTAVAASEKLLEQGLLIPAIRYPTVPANSPRLRISVSSEHSEDDLLRAAEAVAATVHP